MNSFLRRCGSEAIYANGYGMTETGSTLCCSTNEHHQAKSVGIPMPQTNVKVISIETGDELPCGEVGELCFSTPNLMTAYYRNEAATKDILFTDALGTRWIHTGDLGKVDSDGYVFVTGRLKRIFYTRDADGVIYRLFPQRIEEFISNCAGVESCAVLVKEDKDRLHVPSVFVTATDTAIKTEHDLSALWRECQNGLSAHEQPIAIHVLPSMPMTPSGKIDYQALEKLAESLR